MDTLIGAVVAVAVVLPGFVTQELTVRGRPSVTSDGQIAVQRALFYAVVIQFVWGWDTWGLAHELAGHHPYHHYLRLMLWVLIVVLITPAILGLVINAILLRAESGGGDLNRFHYALGGRDAREAWDYLFLTLDQGGWVLVRLLASSPELPVMFIGRYGKRAIHAHSPATHDVYFDEVWSADDVTGRPLAKLDHLAGMWVPASQIEALFPLSQKSPGEDLEMKKTADRSIRLGRLSLAWTRRASEAAGSESPGLAGVRAGSADSLTVEDSPALQEVAETD